MLNSRSFLRKSTFCGANYVECEQHREIGYVITIFLLEKLHVTIIWVMYRGGVILHCI